MGTGDIKSILALVDKNNPAGPPPANPYNDPQYKNWQAGINNWLGIHYVSPVAVPQEYDDIHSPNKIPIITFLNPSMNSVSAANLQNIIIKVDASYPIKEVSLFIDDGLISSKTNTNISQIDNFVLDKPLPSGDHKIQIIVYDNVDNKVSAIKQININQ